MASVVGYDTMRQAQYEPCRVHFGRLGGGWAGRTVSGMTVLIGIVDESDALIAADGWKLVEIDRDEDKFQLYNIAEDNQERHNLENQYPERVAALKAILMRELDSERPDLHAE